ncbi:hypothetical protein MBLNU459_g1955t1 [Dothideomycetes sp. NU459]
MAQTKKEPAKVVALSQHVEFGEGDCARASAGDDLIPNPRAVPANPRQSFELAEFGEMSWAAPNAARVLLQSAARTARASPFVCAQCRSRGFSAWSNAALNRSRLPLNSIERPGRRQWSSSGFRLAEKSSDHTPKPPRQDVDGQADATSRVDVFEMPAPPSLEPEQGRNDIPTPPLEPPPPPPQDAAASDPLNRPLHEPEFPSASSLQPRGVASEPKEPMPSERAEARLELSKRLHVYMEDFLAKAAIASQHLNSYTGTDYSGIERLRREIIEQGRPAETVIDIVVDFNAAKEAYTTSYTDQAASQKEVVGLLERKHSWSAGDLERYMSLIRSEHVNEQAVQAAKDDLASAERTLEEARSLLEKKERKQYHEEQVWSDTIRRNSTWVTFGLMGLNIFLLLANLVIIEPWRRRRLVREVRSALEENANANAPAPAAPALAAVPTVDEAPSAAAAVAEKVETVIDKVAEPVEAALETMEADAAATVPQSMDEVDDGKAAGKIALAAGEVLPAEAVEVAPSNLSQVPEEPVRKGIKVAVVDSWGKLNNTWKDIQIYVQDLFSERQVTLKQVDVTTVALQGAAAGVTLMGFLFVLLRSK